MSDGQRTKQNPLAGEYIFPLYVTGDRAKKYMERVAAYDKHRQKERTYGQV
jgi:hypothetical protein